ADEGSRTAVGHPVDVVTGAMFTDPSDDFVLRGLFPFVWKRKYQSSMARSNRCGLGHGWSHDHYWSVDVCEGSLWVNPPDSESSLILPFLPPQGRWIALPFGRLLSRRGDDILLKPKDGLLHVLRKDPKGVHRLTEIVNSSGNVVRLGWTDNHIT